MAGALTLGCPSQGCLAPDPLYHVRTGPILGTDVCMVGVMSRTQRAFCAFGLVPVGPSPAGIATGLWYGALRTLLWACRLVSPCTEVQEGRMPPSASTQRDRLGGVGGREADTSSIPQLGRGIWGNDDLLQRSKKTGKGGAVSVVLETGCPGPAQQLRSEGCGLLASESGLSTLSHCIFCWCC